MVNIYLEIEKVGNVYRLQCISISHFLAVKFSELGTVAAV